MATPFDPAWSPCPLLTSILILAFFISRCSMCLPCCLSCHVHSQLQAPARLLLDLRSSISMLFSQLLPRWHQLSTAFTTDGLFSEKEEKWGKQRKSNFPLEMCHPSLNNRKAAVTLYFCWHPFCWCWGCPENPRRRHSHHGQLNALWGGKKRSHHTDV